MVANRYDVWPIGLAQRDARTRSAGRAPRARLATRCALRALHACSAHSAPPRHRNGRGTASSMYMSMLLYKYINPFMGSIQSVVDPISFLHKKYLHPRNKCEEQFLFIQTVKYSYLDITQESMALSIQKSKNISHILLTTNQNQVTRGPVRILHNSRAGPGG